MIDLRKLPDNEKVNKFLNDVSVLGGVLFFFVIEKKIDKLNTFNYKENKIEITKQEILDCSNIVQTSFVMTDQECKNLLHGWICAADMCFIESDNVFAPIIKHIKKRHTFEITLNPETMAFLLKASDIGIEYGDVDENGHLISKLERKIIW